MAYLGSKGKLTFVSNTGGPYGNFAGRDASRGLAKGSFDLSMLTDPHGKIDSLEDLGRDEWDELRQWAGHFHSKYDHVGYVHFGNRALSHAA